jgi:ribosomal protein L37AE/L43A
MPKRRPDCPDCETDVLVETARVADRWRCFGCDQQFAAPLSFSAR